MPEPTVQDRLEVLARRGSAYGWHTAMFLLGLIAGYLIGYVA